MRNHCKTAPPRIQEICCGHVKSWPTRYFSCCAANVPLKKIEYGGTKKYFAPLEKMVFLVWSVDIATGQSLQSFPVCSRPVLRFRSDCRSRSVALDRTWHAPVRTAKQSIFFARVHAKLIFFVSENYIKMGSTRTVWFWRAYLINTANK